MQLYACSASNFQGQVGKMNEIMCNVNDYNIASHEVKPLIGRVKFFNTTKCSAKNLSPSSKLSVTVAVGFSSLPFATCI